ncbi:MAG: isoprenylcysteine carboxylmethyltransferase family protein [Litorimonas sp.]
MTFRIPPLIQYLLCAILAWAVSQFLPSFTFNHIFLQASGGILVLCGIILLSSAVMAFMKHKTSVNPVNLDQTQYLVTKGFYRYSRNPMYLGFLLLLIGQAALLTNLTALIAPAIFYAVMTTIQIKPEEKALTLKFGEAYIAYCRRTRRWL